MFSRRLPREAGVYLWRRVGEPWTEWLLVELTVQGATLRVARQTAHRRYVVGRAPGTMRGEWLAVGARPGLAGTELVAWRPMSEDPPAETRLLVQPREGSVLSLYHGVAQRWGATTEELRKVGTRAWALAPRGTDLPPSGRGTE